MLTFVRNVTTAAPAEAVHAYLTDFTTVNEWDPRASSARRVRGSGAEGTVYECEVAFARRTVPMRYTVWLLDRLLRRAVSRLCDDARDGLQAALEEPGRRVPAAPRR